MKTDSPARACCSPAPRAAVDDAPGIWGNHSARTLDLVEIAGGEFLMGSDHFPHPEDGEGPARPVRVDGFQLARFATRNDEFAEFIAATGYQTDAERVGGSFVFDPVQTHSPERLAHAPWWRYQQGASWRNPLGDNAAPADDLPVVQISHNDARAYAQWAGARLPTEAEWEYAARGGLEQCPFPWGSQLTPNDEHHCNVWQGSFPNDNSEADGFYGAAPVNSFAPNGYGLFNMTGNTWEWVADRFSRLHSPKLQINPKGPLSGKRFVMKGGSFLCHDSYCSRYRTSSRTANLPHASAVHIGFRIAN